MDTEHPRVRKQRSIYRVHYALPPTDPDTPRPVTQTHVRAHPRPHAHMQLLERYEGQVAGHRDTKAERYLGLLKCDNGTILKPVIKETQRREIDFYETVSTTTNHDLLQLRKHITKYHGWKKFTYNGHESDYLILDDLADGMLEPSIMDVKIGRRTWDPLATEEKIASEKSKYADCKREVAFCVPGFQVYDVASGIMQRFDKDYGKKLNGTTVREALHIFLNAASVPPCRSLVLQLLSELWRVQRWAARQTAVKLYSASLLLVYDTQRLRECCGQNDPLRANKTPKCSPPATLQNHPKSLQNTTSIEPHSASFSGQLSSQGPVYRKISSAPTTPMSLAQTCFIQSPASTSTPWHDALKLLKRSHSFTHNYDVDMSKAKLDYRALLDQLSSESRPKPWVSVKIIDFVHAFFNDEEALDDNFREGIDSLVGIFEELLRETEYQKDFFA